jgi:hypothetical protein
VQNPPASPAPHAPGPGPRAAPAGGARGALAECFERYARDASDHGSELYTRLSHCVAASPELLDLAALAPRGPVPNLLFGAVHYLVRGGAGGELAELYAAGRAGDGLCASFARFCREHRPAIERLMATRRVQTNEVNRTACTLPALGLVHALGGGRPLGLVELGASAGLNLLFDRYAFDYGDGRRLGRAGSPLVLCCELRGERLPPLPDELPEVGSRLGVDLHPIDLRDPAERAWIQALVWPDHARRAAVLEQAIALALQPPGPPRIVAGDAARELPGALESVSAAHTPCVLHSSIMAQLEPATSAGIDAGLCAASAARPIYRVSAENYSLRLRTYAGGALASERELAATDGHGRWMRWLE